MITTQTWYEVPKLDHEVIVTLLGSVVMPDEAGQRAIEIAFERSVLPSEPDAKLHGGPYPVVHVVPERDDVCITILTPRPRTVVLKRRFLLWTVAPSGKGGW